MIKLLGIAVQLAVAVAMRPIAKRRRARWEAEQDAEPSTLASALNNLGSARNPPCAARPDLPDDLHGAIIAIQIRLAHVGGTPIYSASLNPRDVSVLRAVCDSYGIDPYAIMDAGDPYAAARAELDKSPLRRAMERVT